MSTDAGFTLKKASNVLEVAPILICVKLPEPLIRKLPLPLTLFPFKSRLPPNCGVVSSLNSDIPLLAPTSLLPQ